MSKHLGYCIIYYLRFFARLQLAKNKQAIVVGITGSAGKTSVRLALARILSHKGKVKQSVRANSESGISLNILGLKMTNYSVLDWLRVIILAPLALLANWEKYDYYIVEMGIDSPDFPKNMDFLLTILRPHVAVILNAGLVHAEAFDHLIQDRSPHRRVEKIKSAIAKEKMKLAQAVSHNGVAIINLDQKELRAQLKTVSARVITFGKRNTANLKMLRLTLSPSFSLDYLYQSQKYSLKLETLFEEAYAYTFSAAIATSTALGISPAKSIRYLKGYETPRGRLRVFQAINASHLIDSSYNASPDTMHSALKLLTNSAGKAHRVAVLGDMRELGSLTKQAHKNLADWIIRYADEAVLYGEYVLRYTYPILRAHNFPAHHFRQFSKLNYYLTNSSSPGTWYLVKGSQNKIFLERAVSHLLADKNDLTKLCRRGKYWDSLRAKTP